MFMTLAPTAHAEYYFYFSQFDEAGDTIENGKWRCSDAQMWGDRCTQGIMLVIEGKPRPIEMRFKDDNGILRITMAAADRLLLEARSVKPLVFGRKKIFASTIEAWQTAQPVGSTLGHDHVFRPAHSFLAAFSLVVRRGPVDPTSSR
jgi:hypothetical protein